MAADPTMSCNGCGKPIENNEQVKRVEQGTVKSGNYKAKKEWGLFHTACFNRSFDHPDTVLELMKDVARAGR